MQSVKRAGMAIVMTILLSLTNGCSDMDTATKNILEQADTAYSEGRFTDAQTLYRKVLDAEPSMGRVAGQLGLLALWRNDLGSAENYLKTAQKNGPWWSRRWPIAAQINYYLALAYSRAGRVAEAAEQLRKAAGPLPYGPFKPLKVNADQLALFDDANFYQIEGQDEVAVPFVITDPLPVVQVSVNGSEPVNFFVDTGGEGITLDHGFATEVEAKIVGEYAGEYAGGKPGMTGFGKIDELHLGELVVRNIPVTTLDLAPTSHRVFNDMPIGGIIGTGFLLRFLATIDYPKQRLLLRRQAKTKSEIDKLLGLNGQEQTFPMWLVATHLIFAEGSVNDLDSSLMFIDTGLAGAAFMTSKKTYAEAGVEMDWSKPITGAGGGGEVKGITVAVEKLTLGNGDNLLCKQNLIGVVTEQDNSIFNGAAGFRVGGLISHQFFRDHALTFDFRNMRLIVQ